MKFFIRVLMLALSITSACPAFAASPAAAVDPAERITQILREKTAQTVKAGTQESREQLLADVTALSASLSPEQRLGVINTLISSMDEKSTQLSTGSVIAGGVAAVVVEILCVLVVITAIKSKDPFFAEAGLYAAGAAVILPVGVIFSYIDSKKKNAYKAELRSKLQELRPQLVEIKAALETQISVEQL